MKQQKRIKCRIFHQLENTVWQGLDTGLSFVPCNPNLANAICAAFSRLQPSSHSLPRSSTPTMWASRARITSSALQIRTLFLKSGMSSWSSTKKKSSKGVRNFQDKHSASQTIFVCVTFSQCLVNPKILRFFVFFLPEHSYSRPPFFHLLLGLLYPGLPF